MRCAGALAWPFAQWRTADEFQIQYALGKVKGDLVPGQKAHANDALDPPWVQIDLAKPQVCVGSTTQAELGENIARRGASIGNRHYEIRTDGRVLAQQPSE